METIIDAKGESIGRIAGKAASLLRGKNSPAFAPNVIPSIKVKIINVSQAKFLGSKLKTKIYSHYTGYPSGLRQETLEKTIAKKGHAEIMRRAVSGMLPNNKLKPRMIKNLIITE